MSDDPYHFSMSPFVIALVAAVLLTIVLLFAGCASTPRGSFCDIEHPTRLSDATIDVMPDVEVADALAHNRKGEKLCGWKP
jgi:hypothetical protein